MTRLGKASLRLQRDAVRRATAMRSRHIAYRIAIGLRNAAIAREMVQDHPAWTSMKAVARVYIEETRALRVAA